MKHLFEKSDIMYWSAGIFVFNLSLTVIEAAYDCLTGKSRRWRDSAANVVIFFLGRLLERLVFGAIAFSALLPFFTIARQSRYQ